MNDSNDSACDSWGAFVRHGSNSGLRYERRYNRPVETVWKALTEPARLADWMGEARVDPYVGGRYELFVNSPAPMRGKVVTWHPPELLEFSWTGPEAPASVVRCELVRDGAGTRLIFMHRAIRFAATCLTLGVFRMNYLKQQRHPLRQAVNFWLVVALHLAFFYLVVTGLGHSMIEVLKPDTEVRLIDPPKPPEVLPLPPPKLLPPPPLFMETPFVKVDIPRPTAPTAAVDRTPDVPPTPPAEKAAAHAPVAGGAGDRRGTGLRQAGLSVPRHPGRLGRGGRSRISHRHRRPGGGKPYRQIERPRHAGQCRPRRAVPCAASPRETVDGRPERSVARLRYNWRLDQ